MNCPRYNFEADYFIWNCLEAFDKGFSFFIHFPFQLHSSLDIKALGKDFISRHSATRIEGF